MRGLYLILALIPLAIAVSKEMCDCPEVRCPGEQPAQCNCINYAAIACAKKCGTQPTTTECPPSTATPTAFPDPMRTRCGSRGLPNCAEGQTCVDNPHDSCDPAAGGADCPGICAFLDGHPQACGTRGLAPCPEGKKCVDKFDACDPAMTADCPGICV